MKPKLKTCKACAARYEVEPHHRQFQNWCSIDCGITIARKKQDKARQSQRREFNAETRQRKKALETAADWLPKAQKAFNRYIRARDRAAGLGCVSCGTSEQSRFSGGYFDAGHYRAAGGLASHLRFCPINVWAQCKRCNRQLSANLIEYRMGLIDRIGIERVEWLETNYKTRTWRIDHLKRIATRYNRRARILEDGH